jgi:CRP-like cAMP-binding protein
VRRGSDLVTQGDVIGEGHVILEGCAASYKTLPDGRRQVLTFYTPGDLLGLLAPVSPHATSGIVALTDLAFSGFQRDLLLDVMKESPRLAAALAWSAAREQEILAEHLVSVGRRSARERVAHLILELWARLRVRGLTNGHAFSIPLTQATIADTLGLSVVHVNRTLRGLETSGMVTVRRDKVSVDDLTRLQDAAGFDEDFLLHHYAPKEILQRIEAENGQTGFPPGGPPNVDGNGQPPAE